MPVYVVRGESPRDGALPLRHLSVECPALLSIEDEAIERVRNTRRLRERTQRCRAGCWAEYESEYESDHAVHTDAQPSGAPQPSWPIKHAVSLLDTDVNGPEEHPFAELEVQWTDERRVRITLLGGAPAQIRQAHLTGKPGQDNVVVEFESPFATPDEPDRPTPTSSEVPRGTVVTSKTDLVQVLRRWLLDFEGDNIRDLDSYPGNTAWVLIDLDGHRFRMHADTTRPAIERYLQLAAEHGAELTWHVVPTARSGAVRKVCIEPDASPTPGLFIYSQTTFDEPMSF